MSALTVHDQRPEHRVPCREWGHVERGYGREGNQTLLGVCTCNAWEACVGCGVAHVWVWLCRICASRRP